MTPVVTVLPCPFCGEPPVVEKCKDGEHMISCQNDACKVFVMITGPVAHKILKVWNTQRGGLN